MGDVLVKMCNQNESQSNVRSNRSLESTSHQGFGDSGEVLKSWNLTILRGVYIFQVVKNRDFLHENPGLFKISIDFLKLGRGSGGRLLLLCTPHAVRTLNM